MQSRLDRGQSSKRMFGLGKSLVTARQQSTKPSQPLTRVDHRRSEQRRSLSTSRHGQRRHVQNQAGDRGSSASRSSLNPGRLRIVLHARHASICATKNYQKRRRPVRQGHRALQTQGRAGRCALRRRLPDARLRLHRARQEQRKTRPLAKAAYQSSIDEVRKAAQATRRQEPVPCASSWPPRSTAAASPNACSASTAPPIRIVHRRRIRARIPNFGRRLLPPRHLLPHARRRQDGDLRFRAGRPSCRYDDPRANLWDGFTYAKLGDYHKALRALRRRHRRQRPLHARLLQSRPRLHDARRLREGDHRLQRRHPPRSHATPNTTTSAALPTKKWATTRRRPSRSPPPSSSTTSTPTPTATWPTSCKSLGRSELADRIHQKGRPTAPPKKHEELASGQPRCQRSTPAETAQPRT